jgi:hypothetical protein
VDGSWRADLKRLHLSEDDPDIIGFLIMTGVVALAQECMLRAQVVWHTDQQGLNCS